MLRFALKMLTYRWDLSYNELLSVVGIPKLKERRLCLKPIQVFKIVRAWALLLSIWYHQTACPVLRQIRKTPHSPMSLCLY